ncbi:phosphoadenosine phosphosulfate reductase family protein [uncultured Flavonifractor sp.]|uniref:phosphoadenosine phosphosulfate reductase domain-containing protein n=1 Tax=uncultured Flavonifractor sp. TaxID=1193534 RepID=UPI00261FCD4D|nr:phosphoadenosine phosphosulfate reductase family protein [uncultured Flavonifractor sp.]
MWCTKCNIETEYNNCPECHSETVPVPESGVYWCETCQIPVMKEPRRQGEGQMEMFCPLCGRPIDYLSSDMRPVFPEERLLLELLLNKKPHTYMNASVWASNSRYYINGKSVSVSTKHFQNADTDKLGALLKQYQPLNSYEVFNKYIDRFIRANSYRLYYIKKEATDFIKRIATHFDEERLVISFSGGKDSTATADVVVKALGNPRITHIFGDTTLEFPMTYAYSERFSDNNPHTPVWISKNYDQDFYAVCEDIGPPARMMRWCCSMFKTGPITRLLNEAFPGEQILTFYGIRKCESVSRSKYSRVTHNNESVKIQKQTVAAPIFFWSDLDVWLYILGEHVDFNDAYRLGYDRVGCWCCPNNNSRAQFLSRIYMPEQSKKWREFLISFAKRIGKPDPEVYVDTGKWKARQGGNGLAAANDVKIKFTNCTAEDHAKIYSLTKPFDDSFIGMMSPFGIAAPELGRKLIQETIIIDVRTKVPIISIQPFSQHGYDYAVKIKTMNVAKHEDLQRVIGYQVRKFNACRKCLKCESICKQGAIMIVGDEYIIDPEKCIRCKKCVSAKYLDGGCMMDKYLKTK